MCAARFHSGKIGTQGVIPSSRAAHAESFHPNSPCPLHHQRLNNTQAAVRHEANESATPCHSCRATSVRFWPILPATARLRGNAHFRSASVTTPASQRICIQDAPADSKFSALPKTTSSKSTARLPPRVCIVCGLPRTMNFCHVTAACAPIQILVAISKRERSGGHLPEIVKGGMEKIIFILNRAGDLEPILRVGQPAFK